MTTSDERIAEIVAYAYANAPGFRQIMDGAGLKPGDVRGAADLSRIPVTSKDALIQMQQAAPPFGGWLAVPLEQLQRIYLSPGPIYDPHGVDDESLLAGFVEAYRALGIGKGDRVVNAFLYHMVPAGLGLDESLRAVGATVVPMGPGNTELQIKVIMDLNLNGYVGTPSFLDIIYQKAAEMNLPASALPLEKAFFTAEPYPPSLRQKFEGEYGLRTGQAYATADLGVIAYDAEANVGLTIPGSLYVEIADPETGAALPHGEAGEVVVTTFSRTYPLIRFGTGDLSVMDPSGERLVAILGRCGEAIKVRGMFLHPNQLKAATSAFVEIKHAAAIITRQEGRDVLTLQVELHGGRGALNREKFAEALQAAVQDKARLRVDEVAFVEAGVIDPAQRAVRDERRWD